jgi:hypothetical protein
LIIFIKEINLRENNDLALDKHSIQRICLNFWFKIIPGKVKAGSKIRSPGAILPLTPYISTSLSINKIELLVLKQTELGLMITLSLLQANGYFLNIPIKILIANVGI